MKTAVALLTLCCLSVGPAQGKTYKCKDTEGNPVFSDTACNAVAREEMKLSADKSTNNLDQEAIKNCLAYLQGSRQLADPAGIKIAASHFEWVAVKDIGSRRMLYLDVRLVNQYGVFGPAISEQCLMMGDGRTVSTYPYELLETR